MSTLLVKHFPQEKTTPNLPTLENAFLDKKTIKSDDETGFTINLWDRA
jgi:hypothetical protein